MLKVVNRKAGEKYDVIPEAVDINYNGKYVLRYRVGIQGHNGFNFIHNLYDNDAFNNLYRVIEEGV